jgi:hypothetical protein
VTVVARAWLVMEACAFELIRHQVGFGGARRPRVVAKDPERVFQQPGIPLLKRFRGTQAPTSTDQYGTRSILPGEELRMGCSG